MVKDELQALQLAYTALEARHRKTTEENQDLVSIQQQEIADLSHPQVSIVEMCPSQRSVHHRKVSVTERCSS